MRPEISSADAEVGMIAAMLLDPSTIPLVQTIVTGSDIRQNAHREFFCLLVDMQQAGESVRDTVLVINRTRESGLLDRLGGPTAFRVFTNPEATPNAAVYARQVRDHSVRRQTIDLAEEFRNRVHEAEPADLVSWLRVELDAIESKATDRSHVSTITESCESLLASIEETLQSGRMPSVETGIEDFDNVHGGLLPGRLYVIAARPGVGKSSLAQQMAESIAFQSHAAHFVSLEMPRAEIAGRFLARRTGINAKFINTHIVNAADVDELRKAANATRGMPFTVSEPFGRRATLPSICAEARVQRATKGISVLICDYLQIIEPTNNRQSEYERVSEATRAFKQLSRELKMPVVLLSQLNRDNEKGKEQRRPRLSDLRGSGSIEQDADCVILLHQESRTEIHFNVAKMRGGETNETLLKFDGATCTFTSVPTEDHPNYRDEFSDYA